MPRLIVPMRPRTIATTPIIETRLRVSVSAAAAVERSATTTIQDMTTPPTSVAAKTRWNEKIQS
jgi:hypothetical protein